jgi:hypothetical protein
MRALCVTVSVRCLRFTPRALMRVAVGSASGVLTIRRDGRPRELKQFTSYLDRKDTLMGQDVWDVVGGDGRVRLVLDAGGARGHD